MIKQRTTGRKRPIYYLLSTDIYFHEDGRRSLMPMARIKSDKKRKRKRK